MIILKLIYIALCSKIVFIAGEVVDLSVLVRDIYSIKIVENLLVPIFVTRKFGNVSNYDCTELKHLVLAEPVNACADQIRNAKELRNNIAIAFRGTCTFHRKVAVLGWSGAAAVIIVNNENEIFEMEKAEINEPISIPGAMISKSNGNIILKKLLDETILTSETLELTCRLRFSTCFAEP